MTVEVKPDYAWWLELADAMNAALGYPTCMAVCEHGGRCGLDTGHDGDHDADGKCQWK